MTRAQVLERREQYVMQRAHELEKDGEWNREAAIRADNDAAELFPMPEAPLPGTLDELLASGDPEEAYEEWYL